MTESLKNASLKPGMLSKLAALSHFELRALLCVTTARGSIPFIECTVGWIKPRAVVTRLLQGHFNELCLHGELKCRRKLLGDVRGANTVGSQAFRGVLSCLCM